MLEQVPVTEKHRKWLDEVSNLFGGLDVITVEAIATKDGKEIIYEVTGSQMTLMGETAEEDRRLISELVTQKMSSITYRSPLVYVHYILNLSFLPQEHSFPVFHFFFSSCFLFPVEEKLFPSFSHILLPQQYDTFFRILFP